MAGSGEDVLIRPGVEADLAAITAIYNHYVVHTHVTFDLEPFAVEQRRDWWARFRPEGPYRLLVLESADVLCGFAYSGRVRAKPAYDPSIETTIYVHHELAGRGLGLKLYSALFEALRGENLHRAYAGIAQPNLASVALHRRLGFESIGTWHEVGYKFDRYWDVQWFEKPLQ